MKHPLLAAALGCALAGCSTTGQIGLAVQIAQGVYCTAITEEGKQALRNAVTGGTQLIACPAGTATATTGAHGAQP
jgi:hypothetical protein